MNVNRKRERRDMPTSCSLPRNFVPASARPVSRDGTLICMSNVDVLFGLDQIDVRLLIVSGLLHQDQDQEQERWGNQALAESST